MLVFLSFDKLNKCVETKIKKKRAQAVSLKDASTNKDSSGLKFFCSIGSFEIQIQAGNQGL